jgi:hypothetical protein
MQLIRCTQKLQKELGLKPSDLAIESPNFSLLGQWHANLIYIEGRKCVLFANDKTLINFIAPDLSRAQIRQMGQWFSNLLSAVLHNESIDQATVTKVTTEYDQIEFAKTENRSVLGSLNDLAFHYEYLICEQGGVHSPEIPTIIHQLNHMPMSPLKYVFPIDELKALYGIES